MRRLKVALLPVIMFVIATVGPDAFAAAPAADGLELCAPMIEELGTRTVGGVRQKVFRARFYVCNRGGAPLRVATKFPLVLARADAKRAGQPILLELTHCRIQFDPARAAVPGAGKPFVIAYPPAELGVTELRPGEGIGIVRDFVVNHAHWDNSNQTVVIHYCPNNQNGRYDFIQCNLKSVPLRPAAPGSGRGPEPTVRADV